MKQLSYRDLSIFCEQISMMIGSGIMLHAGMQMIADDTASPQKKAIYQEVASRLAEGCALDAALKASSAFPEYMIHLVEIGTRSGKLDTVINTLSVYYSRQHSMRENIKSAIVYPLVLITMMLVVLIFLAAKVLPVFEQVFNSLGAQMSPWAAYIMKIGSLFNQYSVLLTVLVLIILSAGLFRIRTEAGKAALISFLTGKKAGGKFAVSTFASSMSLMLRSGLDVDLSFRLSAQAVSDPSVREKIERAGKIMNLESVSFVEALEKVNLLTNTMAGLLSMGYQAGSIDTAMEYIAELYEEEYQTALMRRVSLIEPVSIVVVSVLIGSILISVMFPLLSVLSSIG